MDCSPPGFPVHHQLPELAQSHVHQVSDAIQPSHPLSSPSPSVFNPSQNQGLFKWVSSSHQVAKVLEFQLQLMNECLGLPMNIQDWFPFGLTGLISLQSKGFQESSPAPQFKSINSSGTSLSTPASVSATSTLFYIFMDTYYIARSYFGSFSFKCRIQNCLLRIPLNAQEWTSLSSPFTSASSSCDDWG